MLQVALHDWEKLLPDAPLNWQSARIQTEAPLVENCADLHGPLPQNATSHLSCFLIDVPQSAICGATLVGTVMDELKL